LLKAGVGMRRRVALLYAPASSSAKIRAGKLHCAAGVVQRG
jgi:hypothetical protein